MSRPPPVAPPAFDPWTATSQEAEALAHAEARWEVPAGGVARWVRAQNVKEAREVIEGGDGRALLWAVGECLDVGLVAPDWLARAFRERLNQVENAQVDSYDKAFGKPFPGKRVDVIRERREKSLLVYWAVKERLAAGAKVGGGREAVNAFEAVAPDFSMSAGDVRKMYYAQVACFRALDERAARLSGTEPPALKPKGRKRKP